jgi:hypothetical protein
MGEDDVMKASGIDGERAVALEGLLSLPLVEPAVEEKPLAVHLDQVHGARDRARRAEEL